jgi:Tfp pilus assembly protein PilF
MNCNNVTLPTAAPSFDAWEPAAFTLEELKRHPEALTAIQKAIGIKPGSATSCLVAGELYELTGHQSDAEREYRSAAAMLPDSGDWMALAGIYYHQGRTEDVINAVPPLH